MEKLEQREGRIIRQGNHNKKVKIFRYVTESTFDSYMWQLIENKQKFISQIMTSKAPVRSCEDVDEAALSYAEVAQQEGVLLEQAYDFEDYRDKVNRYIGEHGDTLAIYKLTHNIKLSLGDYQTLERVFTSELGSKEDYEREFGETPFGLLVRKVAKLDHEAAMQAFSTFINDESLNQRQIAFVYKIINHVEQNGYMDNVADLQKPPFDKPISFIKLFDAKTRVALMKAINDIKDNAVSIA